MIFAARRFAAGFQLPPSGGAPLLMVRVVAGGTPSPEPVPAAGAAPIVPDLSQFGLHPLPARAPQPDLRPAARPRAVHRGARVHGFEGWWRGEYLLVLVY